VEQGERVEVLAGARHPYTRGLLRSTPAGARRGARLHEIAGVVPSPSEWPAGCRFSTRCERAWERCRDEVPGDTTLTPTHTTRCHAVADEEGR